MSVRLVDSMPRENCDAAIVQAARVSYGPGTKSVSDDRALIRYLMRHCHTTPFEMVEFKFHIKCPIFIARQWLRHRTASVNEMSARYSVVPEEYFMPDELRRQSTNRGQGGEEPYPEACNLLLLQKGVCVEAFDVYNQLLEQGVSRELARAHLPQNTFTEFYWKINLHNLLHFLKLRMDDHAQKEIQDLAKQIYEQIKPLCPATCEAFEDFRLGAVTFSRLEFNLLKDIVKDPTNSNLKNIPGKGENNEFKEKINMLNT
jgi:thymidylate synthase (FAD)